ncbi:MAG: hypothetical protein QF659_04285, partial [Dehalococcoidia bacterium]|nr:hypothetical protein [Dehalococcoidia bacterium]
MLAGFAEFFSDSLATHVKKGISEKALQGRHLGGLPFGYQFCWENKQLVCEPEHPGGVHTDSHESPAVQELFRRYASGATDLPPVFVPLVMLVLQGLESDDLPRW